MLNTAAYRQLMRSSGERVVWLKALPCDCYDPSTGYDQQRGCNTCSFGMVYREQPIGANVRVLIGQLRQNYEHPEFGLIQVGQLTVQTMPDEIRLGNLDRLVLLERRELARERVRRGDDLLDQDFPVQLEAVAGGETVYRVNTDCALDAANRKIIWQSGGPAEGSVYAVEYFYRPVYWFVAGEETPPRPVPGMHNMTPQKGFLVRKHPGEA